MPEFSISQHFENKDPIVKSIYERILEESRKFGTVIEEPKKTSIHLVNKSAFAGVSTRKNALHPEHQICRADPARAHCKERKTLCQSLPPGGEADLTR